MPEEITRVARFAGVGLTAAATHYLSVVSLVESATLPPLWANAGGFLMAFGISYCGHRFWTFGDRILTAGKSLPRFLTTALLGFGMNELLFFLLLRYTSAPYPLALALAIITVAVSTYLLSRHWAFADRRQ